VLDFIGHFSTYLTEFMGTFFLVLTVGCVSITKVANGPIAIGSVLMACVFMGGHISGAHYNPAVTFGVFLTGRGKITLLQSLGYVLSQLLGSLIASLGYWSVLGDTFHLQPGPGISNGEATSVEMLYTFLLVSVVLNVATTKAQADNSFYGLAIGFTVVAAATTVGGISGGAFNPAVGFGPVIVDVMHHGADDHPAWIYWVGPLLGAFVAAIGFRVTNYHKEYAEDMTSLYEEPLVPEETI
jgi:aquaporin Z